MATSVPQCLKNFLPGLAVAAGGMTLAWIVGQGSVLRLAPQMATRLTQVNHWGPTTRNSQTHSLQGESLFLNQQRVPVPWQQRGNRIGLADIPLMQSLGIALDDTETAAWQPVRWFTQRPQVLNSWHADGFRYLDITALARQANWQWQVRRGQLYVRTPRSRVVGMSQSPYADGDRITIQLDRPALWVLEEGADTFTLTLQASLDPTVVPEGEAIGAFQENGSPIRVSKHRAGGQQQLQIQGTVAPFIRPRVRHATGPDRVVIDLTHAPIPSRNIVWAPGLRWREASHTVGQRTFPVHQLWLQSGPALTLEPVWPNSAQLPGLASLVKTARDQRLAAAINGGFFNRNNQLPLGAIRRDRRWISGPILGRGVLAWNHSGKFAIDRLQLRQQLTTTRGDQWPVDHINSGYVQAGISLYTADWGATYTPLIDHEILIAVQRGQTQRQIRTGLAGSGRYPIPAEGYLLVFRSYQTAAQRLPPGTIVDVATTLYPPAFETFAQGIGAGPVLVSNGQNVVDPTAEQFSVAFARQAAPRSIVGVTDDNQLLLVAIYLDRTGQGPTLQEAAQVMLQLGVKHALNLDGGNSSSLYLGGRLINRPVKTVGRVHSSLGVLLPQ